MFVPDDGVYDVTVRDICIHTSTHSKRIYGRIDWWTRCMLTMAWRGEKQVENEGRQVTIVIEKQVIAEYGLAFAVHNHVLRMQLSLVCVVCVVCVCLCARQVDVCRKS